MLDIQRAVQAIEHGLLEPKNEDGDRPPKTSLAERMAHHKVPGISLALVDQGAVV